MGLGGRLDSTNVVLGEIAVVTNIGLEHTEILGRTREAIAREKAGILKPGAVLVTTLDADDEAGHVLQARADELGCPVIRARAAADATIEETNVALAGAVLDQLGERGVSARSGEPIGAALIDAATRAAARLPGRMERRDVDVGSSRLPVVFDGAHVPFNIAAVLSDLRAQPDLSGPCVAVVALAADKDAAGFLTELGRRASAIVLHRLSLCEPRTSGGGVACDRDVARPCERSRARPEAGVPARARTRAGFGRLAAGHRIALSGRGAAQRSRRFKALTGPPSAKGCQAPRTRGGTWAGRFHAKAEAGQR